MMSRALSTEKTDGRQIPALDGLRGLAILLVMLFHQTLIKPGNAISLTDDVFSRIVEFGWSGVDLFFVLSGFLITGILFDAKGRAHYFRNFYARRTLRIFPLYYAVLVLSLVILPNLPAGLVPADKVASFGRIEGDEIWYWLYLSNFSIAKAGMWRHGILDISWSLAIEEQFYLIWPTVVYFLGRVALMRVCVGLILLAPVIRATLLWLGADPLAVYCVTPARMDLLAAGGFLALLARDPVGLEARLPWARAGVAAGIASLAGILVWRGELDAMDPVVQVVGYSLIALLYASLLVLTVQSRPGTALHGFFTSRGMRMFGRYSYALYLFHLPLRAVIRDSVYHRTDFLVLFGSQIPGQLIFYVAATALALVFALASWYLFESHLLRLKRFFPSGKPLA